MSYPFGKQGIYDTCDADQYGCDKFHSDREDAACREFEQELEDSKNLHYKNMKYPEILNPQSL